MPWPWWSPAGSRSGTGADDGVWATAPDLVTPFHQNWSVVNTPPTAVPTNFIAGDYVTFDDSTSNTNVNISVANVILNLSSLTTTASRTASAAPLASPAPAA